ncbi:hypothetical protein [Caballeronia udeis]
MLNVEMTMLNETDEVRALFSDLIGKKLGESFFTDAIVLHNRRVDAVSGAMSSSIGTSGRYRGRGISPFKPRKATRCRRPTPVKYRVHPLRETRVQ